METGTATTFAGYETLRDSRQGDPVTAEETGMRRLATIAIMLMAVTLPTGSGLGRTQSPSLSAPRLQASVEIDSRDVFIYRYALENGAASTAAIQKMTIDISLPAGASRLSASGLAHGPGYFVAELSLQSRTLTTGEAIAVGLSAPQPGWRTTVGTNATARWIASNDSALIRPRQRLGGFSLASHGPPSLRRFTVAPYIDPRLAPVDPPQPDALEVERFEQEFNDYVESQSVTGFTLAPSALKAMTPDALLANLASQVAQARTLRWISNDAMTRNVTDKLQAARTAIARSQVDASGNILGGLRTEVAALSGKGFTSEAVALVDLNVQYALRLLANR
jgi:hypothetical protein